MKLNDLAVRMKDYESKSKTLLDNDSYWVIRIDGKAFHSYTKGLNKPFDFDFIQDMNQTAEFLCKEISGSIFAYTQSDEISIIVHRSSEKSDTWFGGRVQKICSVAASLATAKFNELRQVRINYKSLAYFDARVFELPNWVEVMNYIIHRQQDCTRNAVFTVAQTFLGKKSVEGKNTDELYQVIKTLDNAYSNLEMDTSTILNGRFTLKNSTEKINTNLGNEPISTLRTFWYTNHLSVKANKPIDIESYLMDNASNIAFLDKQD